MKETYEERLRNQIRGSVDVPTKKVDEEKVSNPHLSNLNFDEQLTGKIVHIIRKGENTIGKGTGCQINLYGPRIQEIHATIYRNERNNLILQRADDESKILLNGDPVTTRVTLNHHDRYRGLLYFTLFYVVLLYFTLFYCILPYFYE